MKISIIGAGNVGGLTAMRILEEGIADVVLIDIAKGLAQAKAFDLDDARSIIGHDKTIEGTEVFSKIAGSDIVVVTAGLARKPGMTREDLLKKNHAILKDISAHIKELTPDAIVIVVSNPVDIMTYVMLKETGFDRRRMFGMGAGLDSSRFNNLISKKTGIVSSKINALVLGSHGQTMIPLPELSTVNGKSLTQILKKDEIDVLVSRTKNRGAEIVSLYGSGSAYFAPAAAILDICLAIIKDKSKIIPVSALLHGEYGVKGTCIGVPVKIAKKGISEIIQLDLAESDKKLFMDSAEAIRKSIKVIYPD